MNRKLKLDELNRLSIDDYKKSDKIPVIIVLNDIRSLQNIGSVFRTADGFGIQEIWLQGITAKPPHREINKVALGATQSVQWRYFEKENEMIQYANKNKINLISIEQTVESENLGDYKQNINTTVAYIFGNEVNGVAKELVEACDCCLEIPQYGTKHSFNVAITVGIVLWEVSRGLRE